LTEPRSNVPEDLPSSSEDDLDHTSQARSSDCNDVPAQGATTARGRALNRLKRTFGHLGGN